MNDWSYISTSPYALMTWSETALPFTDGSVTLLVIGRWYLFCKLTEGVAGQFIGRRYGNTGWTEV